MPRITIIETGLVGDRYRAQHGSYPDMFARMIRAENAAIDVEIVSVCRGEALPDPAALQSILITGSPAGVYDALDWIAPLEDFVRAAHAKATPMVGVCFGHQLIAQALGGTVCKSDRGWGLGRHVYRVAPGNGIVEDQDLAIAAAHQDQVIEPPKDAKTFLSSAFTPHAGLLYANGATLTVQPHPEFDASYPLAICEMLEGRAPAEVIATARASLNEPLDSAKLGGAIARFLTQSSLAS
jgi:GMP synthase-like glutamine amidotransferase